ncbi:hypothetical protein ACFXA3_10505 [Streptomyces sp. NPDC059456]|uniref:hypothetical protein n=1 Tax=Streptomyces sp. NPDC059456 TaxID=3346838 RepID=UPI0036B3CD82
MSDRPAEPPAKAPSEAAARRRRGRRWNNVFTGLAVVAAFASLWFSWQGVKAQQTQTEKLDQEVVQAIVSKVGWWYDNKDTGAETLIIENRSLSPVYGVTLDLVDSGGGVVRTASPGDLMACQRAKMDVKGIPEVGEHHLHARLSLTDHRGSHWILNDERTIEKVATLNLAPDANLLNAKGFKLEPVEACG